MTRRQSKVVLVGASSLLGKELNEELMDSALAAAEIVLADSEAAEGQIVTTGDEPTFIQRVQPALFDGADFVFFAGSEAQALKYWQNARRGGATVVDLTGALRNEGEVLTWSPWLSASAPQTASAGAGRFVGTRPDLQTAAIVAAHPAALMLALVAARLVRSVGMARLFAATVLQPASEFGSTGMDELHQQTVSLLSFKDLPKEIFEAQTAFNLLPNFGEAAKRPLLDSAEVIRSEYALLSGGQLPALSLQLLQAPVFHGYTASLLLDFSETISEAALRSGLEGDLLSLDLEDSDGPSNLSVAGRKDLQVRIEGVADGGAGSRFWLWLAADNLKLAAVNAIACALAMRGLRPQGKVQ